MKDTIPLLSDMHETLRAIDSEIEYINTLERRTEPLSVPGQLVTLRALLQEAEQAWYANAGNDYTLGIMRKLAATAAAAMIQFGSPRRHVAPAPLKIYDEDRLSEFRALQERNERD